MPKPKKLPQHYRVRAGDNWFNVAERNQVTAQELAARNRGVVRLLPGQTITIPEIKPPKFKYDQQRARERALTPVLPTQVRAPTGPIAAWGTPVGKTLTIPRYPVRRPGTVPAALPRVGGEAAFAPETTYAMPAPEEAPPTTTRRPRQTTAPRPSVTTPQPPQTMAYLREVGGRGVAPSWIATTYTNKAMVEINLERGNLPLVISPETAEALGLDREWWKSIGYIENADGYLIRPDYVPEEPVAEVAGGRATGGYAGQEFTPARAYGVRNVPQATPYAGTSPARARSRLQEIGLLTWRI